MRRTNTRYYYCRLHSLFSLCHTSWRLSYLLLVVSPYLLVTVRHRQMLSFTSFAAWIVVLNVIWWRCQVIRCSVKLQKVAWRALTSSLVQRNSGLRWNVGRSRWCCRRACHSCGFTARCWRRALRGLDLRCTLTVASVDVKLTESTCCYATLATVDITCTASSRPSRLVYWCLRTSLNGTNALFHRILIVGEKRMKKSRGQTTSFLQCFVVIDWVTGRASGP